MRKDLRTKKKKKKKKKKKTGKKTDGNKLNESQRKILILRSIKNRKKRLMATEGRLISLDNIQWECTVCII